MRLALYVIISFPTKQKMKKNFTLCTIIFLLTSGFVKGQTCIPLVINNSSTTAAACPGGGGISIIATGTSLTYQVTSGPLGYSAASNSTGVFNSLIAGTYAIEVKDACNNVTVVTKTVTNTYPAFNVTSVTPSGTCGSNVSGGTITGTVSGGRPPYQFDIAPVGSSPVYGAATSSTTYNETMSSFGVYRFYTKDACGEVRTYDINLQANQPKPATLLWVDYARDRPCNEIMDGLSTITWRLHFTDDNGQLIDFNNLLGSTYRIYKPNPANSINGYYENNDCTTSLGALLSTGTVTSGNIPPGDVTTYPVVIPMEDVIIVFTTLCGNTYKACHDFNWGDPVVPDAFFGMVQQSCGGTWNSQSIAIEFQYTVFMTAPYTFLLTKNGGSTITNSDGYFYNLQPGNLPATIRVTDACGRTVTKTIQRPVQGSALQATAEPEWSLSCTNIQNTASAYIRITGGDLAGIGDATNVVITGGTVTAVPAISPYYSWVPGYMASNLLAGYTYKINITNLCGEKDSVIFTVPANHWDQTVLNWNLTASVNALCGQNKAVITADANYTSYGTVNYNLYNLSAPNTVISTNTSGVFENVSPGNYKVKFNVLSSNSDCPGNIIRDSVNVSVLGDGVSQTINLKTITNCEVNGVALATGKAIINVSGSAPFTYEIIKTSLVGTGAGEVWTVSSVNNPSNSYTWDLPLAGDPSNTQYTLRSSDKCGNKITTQASLQPLSPPNLQTVSTPCINILDYTLTIAPYAGSFTYRWVKLPDLATTLSTQNTLTFTGPYTAANNGTYRCYISLPGCVDRYKDITVSSDLCGVILPVKLVSFTGSCNNQSAELKWLTEHESGISSYEVERSIVGTDFVKVSSVTAKNNGAGVNNYTVIDNLSNISSPVYFYRLKIIRKDGGYEYSAVIRLASRGSKSNPIVYPNPSEAGDITLSFNSDENAAGTVQVVDMNGKLITTLNIKVQKGTNAIPLTGTGLLPSGSYTATFNTGKQKGQARFVKF
jgi:Secretion system C-terminal sorting domain